MAEPETRALTTIGAALVAVTARLAAAGVPGAGGDARRLVSAAIGQSAAHVLARPEQVLTPDQARTLAGFVQRRAAREPISRIMGEREFYGRTFVLSPSTLDPRPDTETLVDTALSFVRAEGIADRPLRILDVGTGSGALLLTLLCELPSATGIGTDISVAALETAAESARSLGVASRAEWRTADALDGIEGTFDVLVCNPPYIRSGDIAGLDPEVRLHDPITALDGGADGLDIYRRIARRLPAVVPAGWALFEVGYDQADDVAALLPRQTDTERRAEVSIHRDVAGLRRCVAWKTRLGTESQKALGFPESPG